MEEKRNKLLNQILKLENEDLIPSKIFNFLINLDVKEFVDEFEDEELRKKVWALKKRDEKRRERVDNGFSLVVQTQFQAPFSAEGVDDEVLEMSMDDFYMAECAEFGYGFGFESRQLIELNQEEEED